MKNSFTWISTSLSLVAIAISLWVYFRTDRVVFVSSGKLVSGYKGMEIARKEYQKKTATWKANIDTLVKEIKQEIVKFDKESGKMTAKEKDLTKKLIQTKQQQLADYQAAIKETAAKEDDQMTQKVLREINGFIKAYGKKHRYKIILAATDYGNIAFADEALDVTEEVLQGLNENYTSK